MHKMLFNTGVRPWNHTDKHGNLIKGENDVWKNDQLHIAYYLEREPEPGLIFQYLVGLDPTSLLAVLPNQVAIKIVGGGMSSEYAVFLKPII